MFIGGRAQVHLSIITLFLTTNYKQNNSHKSKNIKISVCIYSFFFFALTFDINKAIEEADGFEREKMGQVFHPNFERVSVVQLQVGVNRETKVFLNLFTQLVQQVLLDARKNRNMKNNAVVLNYLGSSFNFVSLLNLFSLH